MTDRPRVAHLGIDLIWLAPKCGQGAPNGRLPAVGGGSTGVRDERIAAEAGPAEGGEANASDLTPSIESLFSTPCYL